MTKIFSKFTIRIVGEIFCFKATPYDADALRQHKELGGANRILILYMMLKSNKNIVASRTSHIFQISSSSSWFLKVMSRKKINVRSTSVKLWYHQLLSGPKKNFTECCCCHPTIYLSLVCYKKNYTRLTLQTLGLIIYFIDG